MRNNKFLLQNVYLSPRNKDQDTARRIYMSGGLLSKTTRNQQSKCIKGMIKQLNFKKRLSKTRNMSSNPINYSERKSMDKERLMRRQSSLKQRSFKQKSIIFKSSTKHSYNSPRVNSSTSRFSKTDKAQKSTLVSELQSASIRLQKQKQLKKLHEAGKNCHVVIIQGTNEEQHYVQVDKIGDIMTYLTKQYPRYKYYKTIPSQLTIDYFLMEGNIDGKFLNGQSLYLKPCGRTNNSLDQHSREEIGLQSFEIIKLIGSGGFSKVFLVRFKEDGKFYAMKVIDKEVIVKNKKKRIIMNQRNIMKDSNHTFVIDMKFAFEAQKYLVFVMEYCAGGELFGLIKKYRRIDEDMAKFYIIQIFLGLSYLHSQKVVYRDIKPENILVCQDGHIKIADLGLAKPDMFQGQLAYSFCGSPQYMSPEMILQVGHTYPVDYYCMGALLYELLTGLPPYYSRDPNQIYQAVLSQELTFPPEVHLTSECKSLLKGLLCKQPKQRLGSMHGVKEILAHPWFGKNQYKKFLEKEIEPPVNFNSIGKVNLDNYTNEQKSKKQVQEVKKEQKIQNKKFKEVMKGFYYDFRENNISHMNLRNSRRQSSEKNDIKKLNFKRKSSNKNLTEQSSRSNKKQNEISKQVFQTIQAQQLKFKLNNTHTNSLRKLPNKNSRSKRLNPKMSNSNLNANSIFKNILNSQRI